MQAPFYVRLMDAQALRLACAANAPPITHNIRRVRICLLRLGWFGFDGRRRLHTNIIFSYAEMNWRNRQKNVRAVYELLNDLELECEYFPFVVCYTMYKTVSVTLTRLCLYLYFGLAIGTRFQIIQTRWAYCILIIYDKYIYLITDTNHICATNKNQIKTTNKHIN